MSVLRCRLSIIGGWVITLHEQKHVFARLRLRITLTCTLLTGAVLLAACLAAFRAAASETQRAAEQTFLAQCQTVENLLSAGTGTDTQALLRFAQQNRLIVAVNDGGTRLSFAPETSEQTLSALVDACALKEAFSAVPEFPAASYDSLLTVAGEVRGESAGGSLGEGAREGLGESPGGSTRERAGGSIRESTGESSGVDPGESYRVHLSGSYRSAVQWHNTLIFQKEDLSNLSRLRQVYCLIFLGGLLLLAAVAWLMSRQMIRPAEAAQQEQLQFFAMASHELKSPLAVITSSVEMLQRGLGDPAGQFRCIRREAGQMARLVDDMLILSGSGTGRWTLHRRPVQPEDVILSAYEAYAGLMEKKGQTLCLRLPGDALPMVCADEQRLGQILTILLDNAYRHTPPGKEIVLCAAQTAHHVIVQVIDHGEGIPDREKKNIFGYFRRGADDNIRHGARRQGWDAPDSPLSSTGESPKNAAGQGTQNTGGFGLGLAVAEELAKLHGASLTVSDTAEGGTTFTLRMPGQADNLPPRRAR